MLKKYMLLGTLLGSVPWQVTAELIQTPREAFACYVKNHCDFVSTVEYLSSIAEKENSMGLYYLGATLLLDSPNKDWERGIGYLERAAKLGVIRAEYDLGVIFGTDELRRDLGRSVVHMDAAAKAGYVEANYISGIWILNGWNGYKENKDEALRRLRVASMGGHLLATTNLGVFLLGQAQDSKQEEEALVLLRAAAKAGEPIAQQRLGFYLASLEPKVAFLEESLMWLEKAAENGVHTDNETIKEISEVLSKKTTQSKGTE